MLRVSTIHGLLEEVLCDVNLHDRRSPCAWIFLRRSLGRIFFLFLRHLVLRLGQVQINDPCVVFVDAIPRVKLAEDEQAPSNCEW